MGKIGHTVDVAYCIFREENRIDRHTLEGQWSVVGFYTLFLNYRVSPCQRKSKMMQNIFRINLETIKK